MWSFENAKNVLEEVLIWHTFADLSFDGRKDRPDQPCGRSDPNK